MYSHTDNKPQTLQPDFAEKRLKLAEILYYKILENIMAQEMKRLQGKDMAVSHSYLNLRHLHDCAQHPVLRENG